MSVTVVVALVVFAALLGIALAGLAAGDDMETYRRTISPLDVSIPTSTRQRIYDWALEGDFEPEQGGRG